MPLSKKQNRYTTATMIKPRVSPSVLLTEKQSMYHLLHHLFKTQHKHQKSEKPENHCGYGLFNGADGRIRTGDLILTKDALYLLSYISASFICRTQELLYYSLRENAIPSGQKNGSNPFFYISKATCLRRLGDGGQRCAVGMMCLEAAYKRKL